MVISSRPISKFHLEPAKMLFSRRYQSLGDGDMIFFRQIGTRKISDTP
jgi:hypothetical protein